MFFRKKTVASLEIKPPVSELPWDDKTIEFFTKSNRFEVQITNTTKRTGFGARGDNEPMREPNGYEISGVITFPKLILVTVNFGEGDDFGFWFYDLYDDLSSLELCVSDPEWKIREAMFESHRAVLLSGRR